MSRKKVLRDVLLPPVFEHWLDIRDACARSLKKKASGFLPADPTTQTALGCGYWGCAWQTGDKRFVVKASIDLTEGPHVALAMKFFRKHPGLAYYHRLWRLPERVWVDEFGYSHVWIMLREEVNFSKQYSKTKRDRPARGYTRVFHALNELPECCSCLMWTQFEERRGECDPEKVVEAQQDLFDLMDELKSTPGVYVGKLIRSAWTKHGILLGDVHYDNVGSRVHNLTKFGVKNHRKLVVTDLGDWGQTPITSDMHDPIPELPTR